jgi:hypothetical protein
LNVNRGESVCFAVSQIRCRCPVRAGPARRRCQSGDTRTVSVGSWPGAGMALLAALSVAPTRGVIAGAARSANVHECSIPRDAKIGCPCGRRHDLLHHGTGLPKTARRSGSNVTAWSAPRSHRSGACRTLARARHRVRAARFVPVPGRAR